MTTNVLQKKVAEPLLHVDEVLPYNEADYDLMVDLKAVLAKHNALNRFGISLLHDHFSLGEDEVMVEHEDSLNRTLITRPVKISQIENGSIAVMDTQWRLDSMVSPDDVPTVVGRCRFNTSTNKHDWTVDTRS